MKRSIALLAAVLLLLAACAAPAEEPAGGAYELYYAARLNGSGGGDALTVRETRVADDASLSTEQLAERLVTALLQGPGDAFALSPFPGGTTLQKLTVAGGRATVDLSAQYARLSNVDLSIADYCLTLTLTQLDGVYAVRVTANGRELPYRKTQLLTAADVLLSTDEDVIRPINVSLYFPDAETGELRAQAQTLALYEGQSRFSAVLDALKRGPAGDNTLRALPDAAFPVLSGRTEDGICYVNLDGRLLRPEDERLRELALDSLARSLLSLDGVDEVQFLVDGEAVPQIAAPTLADAEGTET